MKYVLILFTFFCSASFAQTINADEQKSLDTRAFMVSGGVPFSASKYYKIASGTPYFSDTWMRGTIVTPDKTEYSNLRLKIDLLENSILYLTPSNEERVSTSNIEKIILEDTVNNKGYLFVHSSTLPEQEGKNIWYQVLALGKAGLYKESVKNISETKAYGSSITEQRIRDVNRYFVLAGKEWIRVKSFSELTGAFPPHQKELDAYIKTNKLKWKNEDDITQLFHFYNSLNS